MSFVKGETQNVKCSSWEVWPMAYGSDEIR